MLTFGQATLPNLKENWENWLGDLGQSLFLRTIHLTGMLLWQKWEAQVLDMFVTMS